jgi:Fimbrial assembly protein (PilN)
MISFDFSHSARPEALRRIVEFRVPQHYYAVLLAIAGAIVTIGGAWLIESYRLHQTRDLQAVYQQRYDESVRALKRANVYESRVKRLVALAAKIRSIRSSGYADARRLAEIADNLPPHAWLTSIAYDGDAVSLEGRTKDLAVLSSVIRGLSRAPHLQHPLLSSAAVVSDPGQKHTIRYVLRVESRRP